MGENDKNSFVKLAQGGTRITRVSHHILLIIHEIFFFIYIRKTG